MLKISPLAPAGGFPNVVPVSGVRLATTEAAVKAPGRRDVLLVEMAEGTAVSGVFTRSATRAAPVLWCEETLARVQATPGRSALLVNAGNANAFTGRHGQDAVDRLARTVGAALDLDPTRVFLSSTGVIGEPLPTDRIAATIGNLASSLSPDGWAHAAEAIRTTDTFPKGATATVTLDGTPVTVSGIAKGSGMIAPDMATMLSYIFTDAAVAPPLLQAMLSRLTEVTFNCITVDSDTSTSDTVLLAATGQAPMAPIAAEEDPRRAPLEAALHSVLRDLAHQIVRDGEGATKFVTVEVSGAVSDASARTVARAIANSPLVKTAIAGEDPNWGRIVMAVGKAGEPADRDRLTIHLGDVLVADQGWVADTYTEAAGAAVMRATDIVIRTDLAMGTGRATVWTCDLTHGYVSINADYRS